MATETAVAYESYKLRIEVEESPRLTQFRFFDVDGHVRGVRRNDEITDTVEIFYAMLTELQRMDRERKRTVAKLVALMEKVDDHEH